MRLYHSVAVVLFSISTITVPATAQKKPVPPPSKPKVLSTAAQLKRALVEPDRVVLFQDTADVIWAVRAGDVKLADSLRVVVPAQTDALIFEDRILVGKDSPDRKPVVADFDEPLRFLWDPPFLEGKKTAWSYSKRDPFEMIQLAKGRYASEKQLPVKRVITWWCRKASDSCHPPTP